MESKVLMVGNFVTIMGSIPTKVTGYHLFMMDNYKPSDPKEANYAEMTNPIPLTEDWMIDFGYALFPWGWVKEKSPLICFGPLKKKFWVELGNGFRIQLPYVHTLQNFIALTGQELTIKQK